MPDENVTTETVLCLCGHDANSEHGKYGCDHGCTLQHCRTGVPAPEHEREQEEIDEHGIPWLRAIDDCAKKS